MKIVCVGGGPAGLFFAIAVKLRAPRYHVSVFERRAEGTTYGQGIVYWDDLLHGVRRVDAGTAREICAASVQWKGQRVCVGGRKPVHLGGYGHSMRRQRLIDILVRRARTLGVRVEFDHEFEMSEMVEFDLVVLSDGRNSRLRRRNAQRFGTTEEFGQNKHIWLATDVSLPDFTFAFEETPAGCVWFHAYSFEPLASTVIVECARRTWEKLGFGTSDSDGSVRELAGIFARHLGGRALANRSATGEPVEWAEFVTVTNDRWHSGDLVLLGDSARTVHFSIGSGTRLAFQDAEVLAGVVTSIGPSSLCTALQTYEDRRRPVAAALQAEGARSAAWFEGVDEHIQLKPIDLGFSLRMRRNPEVGMSGKSVRLKQRYWIHLMTQWRLGRVARRAISEMKRHWRAVQHEQPEVAERGHEGSRETRPA